MHKIPQEKVDALSDLLEEKGVKIRFKEDGYDVWWHKIAAWLATAYFWVLRALSLGSYQKRFTDYATTFGKHIYFGLDKESFDPANLGVHRLLRHELTHVYQRDKYGTFLYAVLYLLVLPTVFTYRAKFELEAYTQEILAVYEYKGYVPSSSITRVVDIMTSPTYFFMAPNRRKVRLKLLEIREDIEQGHITGLWPYKPDLFANEEETDGS